MNHSRHLSVFQPGAFGDRRIDIIGAGNTGSRIAMELGLLGVSNLHVHDFDIVESHNLPNQPYYRPEHVGLLKVEALKGIADQAGIQMNIHPDKVDGSQPLGEFVFLLTDTIDSRKQIWERGIRYNPQIHCMIETRMGVTEGRVYTINPSLPSHIKEWEESLPRQEDAATSACGSSISVGATGSLVSGHAIWQFIRTVAIENGAVEDQVENELLFMIRPPMILHRYF